MDNFPKISIVTPSYNQGQFLEQTILSVLNQDYPYIEYIIIDGGSSDESVDIIKKYEKRVAYWISEKDRGQAHAINKGFAKATGSIFAWLNADDLLSPSAARIAASYLTKDSSVGLIFGDRISIDKKGNVIDLVSSPTFSKYMLKWGFTIPQETAFFRRKYFEDVGQLDESLECVMDFDLWCKLLNDNIKIYHIPTVLGYYRDHEETKSRMYQGKNIQKKDVGDGFIEEHAVNFQRHFQRKMPSHNTKIIMNSIWYIQREIEKRFHGYKREREFIRKICNYNEYF